MKYFNAVISSNNEVFKDRVTEEIYPSIKAIFGEYFGIDDYEIIKSFTPSDIQNFIENTYNGLLQYADNPDFDYYDIENFFNEWLKDDDTFAITVDYDNITIVYIPSSVFDEAYDYIGKYIQI